MNHVLDEVPEDVLIKGAVDRYLTLTVEAKNWIETEIQDYVDVMFSHITYVINNSATLCLSDAIIGWDNMPITGRVDSYLRYMEKRLSSVFKAFNFFVSADTDGRSIMISWKLRVQGMKKYLIETKDQAFAYKPKNPLPDFSFKPLFTSQNNEWRPIETAPKDGTEVDLWIASGNGDFRFTGCVFYDHHWRKSGGYETIAWHFGDDSLEPTYWMPIPEPPEPDNN